MKEQAKLAKARMGAIVRSAEDKSRVAKELSDPATKAKLRMVVKPPSPSKGLTKAGAILLLTPDPFTAVPGIALVGAGYAMKRREPLGVEAILNETRKALRDLQGLL